MCLAYFLALTTWNFPPAGASLPIPWTFWNSSLSAASVAPGRNSLTLRFQGSMTMYNMYNEHQWSMCIIDIIYLKTMQPPQLSTQSTDLGFQNLVCVWNGEPECCLAHRLEHWELLEYILWQTMPPMEFMHWLCWSCLCMLSAMYPASPKHTLSLFLSPIHSITIVWLSVCW